jgi:hypothetical protein
MPTKSLIAYANVAKRFDGGRVVAVDNVSLAVAEGDFLAIVGGSIAAEPSFAATRSSPLVDRLRNWREVHRHFRKLVDCRAHLFAFQISLQILQLPRPSSL